MKPAAERLLLSERTCPADQDQERRLEGVLGIVFVAKSSPANAENHRAVAREEGGECQLGGLSLASPESFQELLVRQPADGPGVEERPDMLERLSLYTPRHRREPSGMANIIRSPLVYVGKTTNCSQVRRECPRRP
jgi:hypothetical protein